MAAFGFGFPALNTLTTTFTSPRKQKNPGVSSALKSSMKSMSNVGVGIATLKAPSRLPVKVMKRAAKAVGHQPFDLSGKRKPPPPQPVDKFRHRAQQISHQPFVKVVPPKPVERFQRKATQMANQPFKLLVTPPPVKFSPTEVFANKAKQIAHQPFKMSSGSTSKSMGARFKSKARSIGQLASHPLFRPTLEEELEVVRGRFKSLARAIMRTNRLFGTMAPIDERDEDLYGSNEDAIQAGTNPMLKKEFLIRLFDYLPVPDLKTARLVCEFWKRFSTVTLQKKSRVKLSGICDICKSEWMSEDDSIEAHDHAETISLYNFVLFIQDIKEDQRYFMPFRNFKIKKLNLYFIRGINTAPTRVFLMFLKLWGEKIHELHLQAVQMSPPDSFYRIIDCCKRLQRITFEDIRVWLDPLADTETSSTKFSMRINYYLQAITFITNWTGEELLHWQMIFQAFPCLQELNLIDVSKMETNHCLTALLNLPEEEEEEMALKRSGAFKLLSRHVMKIPFKIRQQVELSAAEEYEEEQEKPKFRSFKAVAKLLVEMPFNINRLRKLKVLEEEQPKKFRKFVRKIACQPFSLTRREKIVPPAPPRRLLGIAGLLLQQPFSSRSRKKMVPSHGRLKKLAGSLIHQPFRLTPKQVLQVQAEAEAAKYARDNKFKSIAGKLVRQPFRLGGGAKAIQEHIDVPNAELVVASAGSDEDEHTTQEDPDKKKRSKFQSKTKSMMGQPFHLMLNKGEDDVSKKDQQAKFKTKARSIVNQPFTLISPHPDTVPETFKPQKFKSQINKLLNTPFPITKPTLKPLDRFKMTAKTITNQPFNLGEPIPHAKVVPGSILKKINVSVRRSYEDQLKADLDRQEMIREELEEDENDDIEVYEEEEEDEGSDSDSQSTIKDSDFYDMETNELLAEVVYRFDITDVTLRINYTDEDAGAFPVVLEACREKVTSLTLTRHAKIYFSELDLKFLSNPFETPEETIMDFPKVTRLTIAHNIVDHINEIRASFPSLQELVINIVTTEFLLIKTKPYKTYVKTNMVLSMKFGRPMPTVKALVWNIQEARHPFTNKRTLVYKSNAIHHIPRVFPNLSKLTVSITTANELHVIFRECTQLHDLIVLKNSFYRTKDEDIIGHEPPEEEQQFDPEVEELVPEMTLAAKRAHKLHPTEIVNEGIKQLKFLRRLSLENNNCCLTDESVEYGFVHLRRLRSLHISRCKRIGLRTLRLLKKCRFLVRVSITKEKLKTKIPICLETGEDDDETENNPFRLPGLPIQTVPGMPNCYIFPSPLTDSKYMAKAQGGFQTWSKYDKIGGKRFDYVTTTYEVNGRTYRLIRRQYDGQEYDSQVWERRFKLENIRQRDEDVQRSIEAQEQAAEIDPVELVRKAEKKRAREAQDEESDYERFMNDYDEDLEDDEDGYCDEDDELLLDAKQIAEADDSSSEDGLCPEADTMYEGDKEHYEDTDPKSSDGESYCDSVSEGEYQADKETGDASDENIKDTKKQGDQMKKSDNQKTEGAPATEKDTNVDKPAAQTDELGVSKSDKTPDSADATTKNADVTSIAGEHPPSTEAQSCIATIGSSCEKEILERTSIELLKNLKEVAEKKLRAREKAKRKESSDDSKTERKKKTKPKEKSERKDKSKHKKDKPLCSNSKDVISKFQLSADPIVNEKVLSWKTEETRDIEYMESLRRVSLSSHGPCHMSPVPAHGTQARQVNFPYDHRYYESTAASDSLSSHTKLGKDRRNKPKRHSNEPRHDKERVKKSSKETDPHKKSRSKEDNRKERSKSQEKVKTFRSDREFATPSGRTEALGDLRHELIKKMVSDVRRELKK